MNRLLAYSRILVSKCSHLRQIAGVTIALCHGHIDAALAIVWDRKIYIYTLDSGLKKWSQGLGGGSGIGIGDIEQQAIRKNPRGARNQQMSCRQLFLVNSQFAEAPRAELQRLQTELEGIFNEPVLYLEMLRGQERAFRPDDRL